MAKPILYVFAISHYCEKARWALDISGIDYELKYVSPLEHAKIGEKLEVPGTSVPILGVGDTGIRGSAEIIDWIDQNPTDPTKGLTPKKNAEDCRKIEKRLDDIIGVHIRRYYYSETILDDPKSVTHMFQQGIGFVQKSLVGMAWPKICAIMIDRMDLGPQQRLESKKIVETELDWLDSLLANGSSYLTGGSFTRADLTAASLLAPLIRPEKHPAYSGLTLPPLLSTEIEAQKERPILKWVAEMYARHR